MEKNKRKTHEFEFEYEWDLMKRLDELVDRWVRILNSMPEDVTPEQIEKVIMNNVDKIEYYTIAADPESLVGFSLLIIEDSEPTEAKPIIIIEYHMGMAEVIGIWYGAEIRRPFDIRAAEKIKHYLEDVWKGDLNFYVKEAMHEPNESYENNKEKLLEIIKKYREQHNAWG